MGRIFFDTDELQNLDTELDSIDGSLSGMMTKVRNFDVPSVWYDWFSQRKFLDDAYCDSGVSNLYREIRKGKNCCDEVEEWVRDCRINLSTFSSEAESSFKKIEDIDLKPRGSIVVLN